MITTSNFKDFLTTSGFTSDDNNIFTSSYGLKADIQEKRLTYPEAIRGREHNTTFDAPENFVVFECVYRLLMKGYRAEDIELEKTWRLGHDDKSGRADICVYEQRSDSVLMIIECKTWGNEYSKALKDTLNDGAQLFSYWQQEGAAKWLVLYSSDFRDGVIEYRSPTIDCSDDKNLVLQAEYDGSIKLYRDADTAEKKFSVWRDTYGLELHGNIIFTEDTVAYDIGIKPLRKRDLEPFNPDDGIVNKFEEILRHNNVSDKENAFNRLIALFICKLVDEITKGEDEEAGFQYRHKRDDYEALQDRLQKLYTMGMKEFMQEEITYIDADYPERLFANYTDQNRDNAIKDLKAAFRKLKFFTNNDFAFKDVHNENLFYQNGKVLVEVVQLFQRYKIVHTSKNQFLGTMFEQLLDKGFKQNEGQFFTPMPITRFIWDSLPLKRFETWPKVIDYACGAGHFLIEAVEAINHFIKSENNSWVRDYIFGIEKDYRLARVSKVSMFMNGAGDSNIIFGDGLENSEQIKPGTFDILTANPPYSVASFKQHLDIKHNTFTLLDTLTPNSSEIEKLFVERIAQLLGSGGIAAVILPSSILSNDSASYTGAREEILRNFMVRAIVQLGSKTFGATGTNTVIMFLERYSIPPERFALVQDSVAAILADRNLEGWEDEKILAGYLKTLGLSREDWREFVNEGDIEELHAYFRAYLEAFRARKETQKLKAEEFLRRFYAYAKKIEAEKLLYFGLTYKQHTTVILAPSDNAGQKEFLGYDWSNKKGDEGIKIAVRGGKLYDEDDREAEGTLAHVVRQSFGDGEVVMTEDNARYARVVRTCDMLDFSRVSFNKAVITREKKGLNIGSKYPLEKLLSVCQMNISKSEAKEYSEDTRASFIDMSSVSVDGKIINKIDRPIGELWAGSYTFFREGDIICAKMLTSADSLKCAVAEGLTNGIGFGSSEFYTFRCGEKIMTRYLCEFLNLPEVRESAWSSVTGTGRLRVPSRFYETMTIPLPPMEIQEQIVNECTALDTENSRLNSAIEDMRAKIDGLFEELDSLPATDRFTLENKRAFTLAIGRRVLNSELVDGGKIPVYSANVIEPFGYVEGLLRGFEDFGSDSVLWGIDGDFMVRFMEAGREFYPTDHCGVLRVLTDRVHPRYMAHVLEREGRRMMFSRSFRASLDRVGGIRFGVPEMKEQVRAMNEVLRLEGMIKECRRRLERLSGQKEEVLKKYL